MSIIGKNKKTWDPCHFNQWHKKLKLFLIDKTNESGELSVG